MSAHSTSASSDDETSQFTVVSRKPKATLSGAERQAIRQAIKEAKEDERLQKREQQREITCINWLQGKVCPRGDKCLFGHDFSVPLPDIDKPCFYFWVFGHCTLGDDCRFTHERGPEPSWLHIRTYLYK